MRKKGFTLTELLFVIVIAAILVALILPRALRAIAQANVIADQSNVDTIQEAVLLCWTEKKDWDLCNPVSELVTDGYLEEAPDHPCDGIYSLIEDPNSTNGELTVFNSDPCTFFTTGSTP